jgi:hypothetical protein
MTETTQKPDTTAAATSVSAFIQEDMAIELANLVKDAVTDLPVLVGEYSARG